MGHDVNSCYFCEHGIPHESDPESRFGRMLVAENVALGFTCMCDFEGHTVTGCTHDR